MNHYWSVVGPLLVTTTNHYWFAREALHGPIVVYITSL